MNITRFNAVPAVVCIERGCPDKQPLRKQPEKVMVEISNKTTKSGH